MERYSRQILFSPIGKKGQKKLQESSVLIVGAGALGTVISNQLVRAGIGQIRIVDRDYVEISNLQRQMLYTEEDVEAYKPKAIAAKERLKKVNAGVHIQAHVTHVSADNIEELTDGIDIIFDGTDNFQTRFLLNDIAYKKNIPFAYGGVISSRGMAAFLMPDRTPCLRCLMQNPVTNGQTCDTVGVINPIVNIVSSIQVTEGLKFMTGNINKLKNKLVTFDIWHNEYIEINYGDKDLSCPTCGQREYPALQHQSGTEETILCGRNTVQIHQRHQMNLDVWEERLNEVASTKLTPFLLEASISDEIKFVIFTDGRVLVQGTEDVVLARTLYDRYIGS